MDGRPANTDREERDARDGSAGFTFLGLQQAPPGGVVPVLQQRVICIHGETTVALVDQPRTGIRSATP